MAAQGVKWSGRARVLGVAFLFGLGVFSLVFIAILAWTNRSRLDESRISTGALQQFERRLSTLEARTLQAEIARRDFLFFRDEQSRDEFLSAIEDLSIASGRLKEEGIGPAGAETLIESLKEEVGRYRGKLSEEAELPVLDRPDQAGSDEAFSENRPVLELVAMLRDEVDARLVESGKEQIRSSETISFWLNSAAISSFLAGLLGLSILFSHMNTQAREMILEKGKLEAERSDREKSKFLASMNHEIRTPLNAMLGFSELLRTEVNTERGRRFLGAVGKSGASLMQLINDILDLSKIEAGMLEIEEAPVAIHEFGENIAILFENDADERGLSFDVSVDPACPLAIQTDALRLRQILVNLIGNALKFTDRGFVNVRIFSRTPEGGDDRDILLGIEVEDSGRGIEPEKLELIFRPFQQAEEQDDTLGGTGLGLSITRELIGLMDGEIELESEVGSGTLFRILIPARTATSEDLDSSGERDETCDFNLLNPSRILAVDDNRQNLDLINGFFEDTHHEIVTAEDGEEGLRELDASDFDLVLMDIRMPRMGGRETLDRMRSDPTLREIPVVAVTASSLKREESELREIFDGYVRKPFSGATLFRECALFLGDDDRRAKEDEGAPSESEAKEEPEAKEAGDEQLAPNEVNELDSWWSRTMVPARESMVFSELAAAATDLERLSRNWNSDRWSERSRLILQKIEAFDLDGIESCLLDIEQRIERLRKR